MTIKPYTTEELTRRASEKILCNRCSGSGGEYGPRCLSCGDTGWMSGTHAVIYVNDSRLLFTVHSLETAQNLVATSHGMALEAGDKLKVALQAKNDWKKRAMEAQSEVENLTEEVNRLRLKVACLHNSRESLDCGYAGDYWETGSHCPFDNKCERCTYEDKIAELKAKIKNMAEE